MANDKKGGVGGNRRKTNRITPTFIMGSHSAIDLRIPVKHTLCLQTNHIYIYIDIQNSFSFSSSTSNKKLNKGGRRGGAKIIEENKDAFLNKHKLYLHGNQRKN